MGNFGTSRPPTVRRDLLPAFRPALVLFFFLSMAALVRAVSPMAGPQALVAGSGEEGFLDGPFTSARFHHPTGLALDPQKRTLFVSDSANRAIRTVSLGQHNRVGTLVSGQGLEQPGPLAFAPGFGLIVVDRAKPFLYRIDPAQGSVSILIGSGKTGTQDGIGPEAQAGGVAGLACDPAHSLLYFTQPDLGTLRVLDLQSLRTRTVLSADPQVPHPSGVLAGAQGIYVSDRDNGSVFRIKEGGKTGTYDLEGVGRGAKVLQLFGSRDGLYALQADPKAPVLKLLPEKREVHSLTQWGDPIPDPTFFFNDFNLDRGDLSILADPNAPDEFFVTSPAYDLVFSFRDLDFAHGARTETLNSQGLMDFEYPLAKPASTYRILLVGDSHLFHDFLPGKDLDNRMDLVAKKLELELNSCASLCDSPTRFEVLTQAKVSWYPLAVWPYHETPAMVQKYGIDRVVVLLTKSFELMDYYQSPLDAEGIPGSQADPEFVLRPWKERAQAGNAKALYGLCQKLGLVDKKDGGIILDYDKLAGDPEALDLMARMYIQPMEELGEKLAGMRTRDGGPVAMSLFLFPKPGVPKDPSREIWARVLEDLQVPHEDLTPSLTALRLTLYPFSEIKDQDHLDPNGHRTLASLLFYYLVRDHQVPLDPFPAKP